jgi:hypothetical protein
LTADLSWASCSARARSSRASLSIPMCSALRLPLSSSTVSVLGFTDACPPACPLHCTPACPVHRRIFTAPHPRNRFDRFFIRRGLRVRLSPPPAPPAPQAPLPRSPRPLRRQHSVRRPISSLPRRFAPVRRRVGPGDGWGRPLLSRRAALLPPLPHDQSAALPQRCSSAAAAASPLLLLLLVHEGCGAAANLSSAMRSGTGWRGWERRGGEVCPCTAQGMRERGGRP